PVENSSRRGKKSFRLGFCMPEWSRSTVERHFAPQSVHETQSVTPQGSASTYTHGLDRKLLTLGRFSDSFPPDRHTHLRPMSASSGPELATRWDMELHAEVSLNGCVPQLVTDQAAAAPGAIAVTYGKMSLSYKELDRRADQLAHVLHSLGVGPDIPVGLYLNRSLAMVVGALAILKAGGA